MEKPSKRTGMRMRIARACALCAIAAVAALSAAGCAFVTDSGEGDSDDAGAGDLRESAQNAHDAVSNALGDAADAVDGALDGVAETFGMLEYFEGLVGEGADAGASLLHDTKDASLTVRDAKSGEELAHVEDAQAAKDIVMQANFVRLTSSHPDEATAEYEVVVWQDETVKLGQEEDDVREVEVLSFTTYEGSDIVTVSLFASDIAADFEATHEFVDSLRVLAAS